jgi:molecular chaperone HtpG
MTPEIVRDYFLKAGASFGRSQLWREEHEDSAGHSRVLRTGRFGVGALAAFLLGDEIEVTSRHAFTGALGGIHFKAKLDDESISLRRTLCPVGTRIKIKIPERSAIRIKGMIPGTYEKSIKYGSGIGHYFLQKPSLTRQIKGSPQLPLEGWLPQPNDEISSDWRCFGNADFERVFWTYKRTFPSMSCNGIIITSGQTDATIDSQIRRPNISVFDKDGLLPVNLQREGLQGEIPFKSDF